MGDCGKTAPASRAQPVVEVAGQWRALDGVALYRTQMADSRALEGVAPPLSDWMQANQTCRRHVLERLRQDGPLPIGSLPDSCVLPWRSSEGNDAKNNRILAAQLVQRGEVGGRGSRG